MSIIISESINFINIDKRYSCDFGIGIDNTTDIIIYNQHNTNYAGFEGTLVLDFLDCDNDIVNHLNENWSYYIKSHALNNNLNFHFRLADNQLNIVKKFSPINVILYSEDERTYSEQVNLLMGDLDYNGLRENEDAKKLQDALANIITLSDLQSQLADCNLDGEISIGDAIWILTHLGNGGNIL